MAFKFGCFCDSCVDTREYVKRSPKARAQLCAMSAVNPEADAECYLIGIDPPHYQVPAQRQPTIFDVVETAVDDHWLPKQFAIMWEMFCCVWY